MKINRLVIENFKSIERIELIEPNPFTVFVGPNGSGKSNIFEALEFVNYQTTIDRSSGIRLFKGRKSSLNRRLLLEDTNETFHFKLDFYLDYFEIILSIYESASTGHFRGVPDEHSKEFYYKVGHRDVYEQFYDQFQRIFVGNNKILKVDFQDEQALNSSASNLEKVLKRVLTNPVLRDEIFEWLELFVPGFKAVEVNDRDELHWFENSSSEYFTKDLISDGTYNILALLTAVYQSDDKPQFLCIEEPENGLHPQVARELVDFFRIMCEERGHYIWLNTHSQSMVSRVRPQELVIVEKKDGATQVRQFNSDDFFGMRVDDAWLTNSLGGGLAW
jgi:predicted ATPase